MEVWIALLFHGNRHEIAKYFQMFLFIHLELLLSSHAAREVHERKEGKWNQEPPLKFTAKEKHLFSAVRSLQEWVNSGLVSLLLVTIYVKWIDEFVPFSLLITRFVMKSELSRDFIAWYIWWIMTVCRGHLTSFNIVWLDWLTVPGHGRWYMGIQCIISLHTKSKMTFFNRARNKVVSYLSAHCDQAMLFLCSNLAKSRERKTNAASCGCRSA